VVEAPCRAHARRKSYELAQLEQAPVAAEAVRRIDVLFVVERERPVKAAGGARQYGQAATWSAAAFQLQGSGC
jgi:hypothetical protein